MTRPESAKTVPPPNVSAGRSGTAAAAQPLDSQKQLSAFESAMRLFHARNLKDARELFLQAAGGPERDVAHRAKLHVAMCNRRLEQSSVDLRSGEDYYNYAIALINARKLTEARAILDKGIQIDPGSDHMRYAMALTQALSGDLAGAFENLKRAIEMDPHNRILARQDADFASFASQTPFDTLLYPEKKSW